MKVLVEVLRKLIIALIAFVGLLVILATAAVLLIDPDDYRDEIAARASDQLGREVSLSGPMSLKLFPWLAIEISEVRVANPEGFGEAPPLADIGSATAAVKVWPLIRGDLELGGLTLEQAQLHLVTRADGRSNLDGLLAEPEAEAPTGEPDLSRFSLGETRLREVDFTLVDERSGETTRLHIDRLDLAPFRADTPVAFEMAGRLSDAETDRIRFDSLEGRLQVAANLGRIELSHLVAAFTLPDAEATGSLRGGVELDLSADPVLARVPVLEAGLRLPEQRIGLVAEAPIEISLGETTRARFEQLALNLGDQPLSASGQVSLGEVIDARLEVQGERLDLRDLLAGAREAPEAEAERSDPADFAALSAITAAFDLELGELVLSDELVLSEVVARARLEDGELELAPLTAGLFGGQFDGRASVDFSVDPPRVVLQPRLSGVHVDRLARLGVTSAPVQGRGDLALDLSFAGFGLDAILASLDGSGDYRIEDGALLGIDLRELIGEELTRSSLGNVRRAFGGQTDFRRFAGNLNIDSGVVELPDMSLLASGFGATGSGTINLGAGMVDYRLQLELGEELLGQLPRSLREATGGRIPLAVSGPLSGPTVMVDVADIAQRALRQQIGERLLGGDRGREEARQEPDSDADPGEAGETEEEAAPERRERGRDLILRTLIERRAADDDEDPDEETGESPESGQEPEEEPEDPPPAR